MDYAQLGYCPICIGNTPEKFSELLECAVNSNTPAVIINAWNEWSEGMFLIPDQQYGYGYLDAIKEINR